MKLYNGANTQTCEAGLTHESGSGPYTAAISLHTPPYLGKGWSGRRCKSHGYSVYKRETESSFVQGQSHNQTTYRSGYETGIRRRCEYLLVLKEDGCHVKPIQGHIGKLGSHQIGKGGKQVHCGCQLCVCEGRGRLRGRERCKQFYAQTHM